MSSRRSRSLPSFTVSAPDPASPRHSEAFETFVANEDDIVGLIAYALYKQNIHETAKSGRFVQQPIHRSPGSTERSAYRGAAEAKITAIIQSGIEQERPEILGAELKNELGLLKGELIEKIESASSPVTALVISVFGWLITLGITFLVAVAGLPHWLVALSQKINP